MNQRIGKKLRAHYWAIADKDGELLVYGYDAPALFLTKPWLSKILKETAVKVKLVKLDKEVL